MKTFFTSDLHLGHKLMARLRGFGEDTHAHDEHIIAVWNTHVQPDDIVWVLGDISLMKVMRFLPTWVQLQGRKHVVLGNHDTAHPMLRGWLTQHQAFAPHCEFIGTAATLRHDGRQFLMSHFPFTEDHTEDARFTSWRPAPTPGWTLLHGHTHSDKPVSRDGIHVGWDAHKEPITIERVLELCDM